MKILVIDDEETIADPLSSFIRQLGYTVKTLYSCRAALDALKEDEYDLIISDVSMPGFTGLDLVEHIRHSGPNIPVVLISGHAEIVESINAIEDGVYDVFEKPVDVFRISALLKDFPKKKAILPEREEILPATR